MKQVNLVWFVVAISVHISSESMQEMDKHEHHHGMMSHAKHNAKMHAPIGIMGDHLVKKGKFMLSIRYMNMSMDKNYIDSKEVTDAEILQLPNLYGTPKNLTIIPQEMDMNMTMLGAMYAPTEDITLMSMATFKNKSMSLKTYQPMMKRNLLGDFKTNSSDLSIINLSALLNIFDEDGSKIHAQLGIEKDIGKNNIRGQVLTPMGGLGSVVLPYGMQSGDKSISVLSAITFTKSIGSWKVGGQIKSKKIINNKEWNYGDSSELNLWSQKDLSSISAWSLRVKVQNIKPIDGLDKNIKAPVQTANPSNYGGQTISVGIGVNVLLPKGDIGLEALRPISRDLNGPQMSANWSLQAGYRLSF